MAVSCAFEEHDPVMYTSYCNSTAYQRAFFKFTFQKFYLLYFLTILRILKHYLVILYYF
jgi:hypothetical protein